MTNSNQLTEEDKALFLKAWGLEEGNLTDHEIVMAIQLGYF